jgi:uncharacterized protein with beta-barrel porin domain
MSSSYDCFRIGRLTEGQRVSSRGLGIAALAMTMGLLGAAAFSDQSRAACVGPCVAPPSGLTAPNNGFGSAQAGVSDVGTHFMQVLDAIMSSRNAASPSNNPQGGGADTVDSRYRTWFEGYGLGSRTSAQGDFPGDHRRTFGGVAGFGMSITPDAMVGLSIDQSRTKIDISGLPQHGTIDLTQIGVLGAFSRGPWQLNTMGIVGLGNIHSERTDVGGVATASYGARLWAAMAELTYYVALPDNSRIVPKLTVDGTWTHTDPFAESGSAAPVSGTAASSSRGRMMIGGEIGHTWLMQRTIMDFLVYARFVDNFVQHVGTIQVSDPAGGFAPQPVIGIRESTQGADAGATLSAKITEMTRIYAIYDGRYRSNFTSHSGTIGAEFKF